MPPAGDLAYNPGMCPDWESNLRPFISAGAQSTEPYQPGQDLFFNSKYLSINKDLSIKYMEHVGSFMLRMRKVIKKSSKNENLVY